MVVLLMRLKVKMSLIIKTLIAVIFVLVYSYLFMLDINFGNDANF